LAPAKYSLAKTPKAQRKEGKADGRLKKIQTLAVIWAPQFNFHFLLFLAFLREKKAGWQSVRMAIISQYKTGSPRLNRVLSIF
jgi:hypothetical protein